MRPHVCHCCHRGGQEHGPYFEDDFHYADPRTGSACRLITCIGCFTNQVNAPDSPLAAQLLEAQEARIAAEDERDLAEQKAFELRADLDEAKAAAGDGPARLAVMLAEAMEDRWGTPPESWRKRVSA